MAIDDQAVERKLTIHEVRTDTVPNPPGVIGQPNMILQFSASAVHLQTQRFYISATEAMAQIGGFANALLVILVLLYGVYHQKLLKKDIIHKGLTLSGKFALDESRLGEFADFYKVKDYKIFGSEEKHDKQYCCRGKYRPKPEGVGCSLEDDRILDEAFGNMMSRQLDLKHMMQMSQDVEIIKKVLFHKRHILLGPIISLENEKRALLASCQGEPHEEKKCHSPHQDPVM